MQRLAVALHERRPQDLLTAQQIAERALQRLCVEAAFEPEYRCELIGDRVGPKVAEQPGAPLRGAQRRLARPPLGKQRRERGAAPPSGAQPFHQACRGPRFEHRADVQLGSQALAYPAGQLQRQQRGAAELEEVLVGADRVELEHLRHQRGDRISTAGLVGRRCRAGAGSAARSTFPRSFSGIESSITITAGTMNAGSRCSRCAPELGGRRRGAGPRDPVADQPLVAGYVFAGDHRGFAEPGVARQRSLDLARLDPLAGDLHLIVEAAEEEQLAVVAEADAVAGAVHRAFAARIGRNASAVRSGSLR